MEPKSPALCSKRNHNSEYNFSNLTEQSRTMALLVGGKKHIANTYTPIHNCTSSMLTQKFISSSLFPRSPLRFQSFDACHDVFVLLIFLLLWLHIEHLFLCVMTLIHIALYLLLLGPISCFILILFCLFWVLWECLTGPGNVGLTALMLCYCFFFWLFLLSFCYCYYNFIIIMSPSSAVTISQARTKSRSSRFCLILCRMNFWWLEKNIYIQSPPAPPLRPNPSYFRHHHDHEVCVF